ncbi:Rap1a/Tai family immunity protein [Lysobacter antibioticus]|uniref:Rap1a/Tai family immunity protein n=1 Tax=Lysobacter antibioticus TaxID=84531 RepID=UPI0011DF2761|nr:Rap1a/Tai family immunity protein [Lysobacter antibioticus]
MSILKANIVLLLALLPLEAFGRMRHEDTGAQLLKDCTHISADQPLESKWQVPPAVHCLGLIEGIVAMNASFGPKLQKFCPPEDITSKDAAKVIVLKLQTIPHLQEWSYASAAIISLRQAYPCKH